MSSSTIRSIFLCAVAVLLVACGVRKDLAFTYHKADVSEAQLIADQQTLRNTPGVQRVHGRLGDQNRATIEVGVKEGYDLLIQEKLIGMGWNQGKH